MAVAAMLLPRILVPQRVHNSTNDNSKEHAAVIRIAGNVSRVIHATQEHIDKQFCSFSERSKKNTSIKEQDGGKLY